MECGKPRVKWKQWTLVIMICPWMFTSCNKCAGLVGDVDDGGGYTSVETGNIWEISVLSSQLCYEPKTALKKKILGIDFRFLICRIEKIILPTP